MLIKHTNPLFFLFFANLLTECSRTVIILAPPLGLFRPKMVSLSYILAYPDIIIVQFSWEEHRARAIIQRSSSCTAEHASL